MLTRRAVVSGLLTAPLIRPADAFGRLSAKAVGDEPYLEAANGNAKQLIVFLHSWSADYQQVASLPQLLNFDDSVIVAPNFGGPNNHPEGAGHPRQLERIKRVIDRALDEYRCRRTAL